MVPVQTYQRNHPLLNATIWARVFHTIRLRTIVFVRMDSRDKVVKLASKSVEAHHVKMVASVQQDSKAQTCSTPVDPCQWAHCQNGGSCLRTSVMTYSCACPSGYSGRFCEMEINPCANYTCSHGTPIRTSNNDCECLCSDDYYGRSCELNICKENPCLTGQCISRGNDTYRCQCPNRFQSMIGVYANESIET